MTILIIITISSLLLLAYVFDLSASKTKIPSVILLLLLGWVVRELSNFMMLQIPDLTNLLPILGTIGLILIVLEGSLEIELNKSKIKLVKKSLLMAVIPMLILSIILSFVFQYLSYVPFKVSLANAIPFCVISSAVAIPSVRYLARSDKEFVTYESSISDILGVLFFDFIVLNEAIAFHSFGYFIFQFIIICIISLVSTIGLSFLLHKIDHQIKYAPIVISIILIYSLSEIYHLPSLIFILTFGLFLGNFNQVRHLKWIRKIRPDNLNRDVQRFTEIVVEGTFLIRALFFILFGYLIETAEIINANTLGLSLIIVALIFLVRFILLKILRLNANPLFFIAPRGLITILLFFAIPQSEKIIQVDKSLIIQVIILTALVMMVGLMFNKTHPKENKIEKTQN